MDRSRTPIEIETSVLVKSARRCTLCFHLVCDLSEKLGQIAHLDQNPSNTVEDNLAFMCLDHHTLYDSKTSQHKNYTVHEVKQARDRLYEAIKQNQHAAAPAAAVPLSDSQRKFRDILPWKGKTIKLTQMCTGNAVIMIGPERGSNYCEVFDCTDSYVKVGKTGTDNWSRSIPMENIRIGHDDTRDCLQLQWW